MNDISEQTHSINKGGADTSISASATETGVKPANDETHKYAEAARQLRGKEAGPGDPDVVLEVRNLTVEEVHLEISNLRVRLALDARLANLLRLTAGAEADGDNVNLTLKGVHAEALLKVRLDNTAAIIDRTLATVDRNPEALGQLRQTGEAGAPKQGLKGNGVSAKAVERRGTPRSRPRPGRLLTKSVDRIGHTIEHVVDRSGSLIENVLDRAGHILRRKSLGSIYDLPVVGEFTDESGRTVRRLMDTTGAVLELTEDAEAGVGRIRVVSPPSS